MLEQTVTPAAWKSQEASPGGQTPTFGALVAHAIDSFASLGVECSTSRVTRLVNRYLRESDAASTSDFDDWVTLTYADPVGELATRNVLAEGVR